MATNDIYLKVVKTVFQGNLGKQMQLLRERENIRTFLESGVEVNEVQQAYIDKVNETWEFYDNKINAMLGTIKIEDMKPEEVIEEE